MDGTEGMTGTAAVANWRSGRKGAAPGQPLPGWNSECDSFLFFGGRELGKVRKEKKEK